MGKAEFLLVFKITFFWIMVSIVQFLIGYGTMIEMGYDFTARGQDPLVGLRTGVFTGFVAGILGGTMIVFAWERWLRSVSYRVALFKIFISYTAVFLVVAYISILYFQLNLQGRSLLDAALWADSFGRIISLNTFVPYFFWLIVVLLTQIALLVNDKYGPGGFKKFLLGKYFRPHREERVFMFLDLRSSTKIAELLGESKYFDFLRDCFKFSTPAILRSKGEIYQYVGDEMVITWPIDKGVDQMNCINCFLGITNDLKAQQQHFQAVYNFTPEFKAGLHCGGVISGEMGIIKREIAYSGDVLNTTSRIQSKCNEMGVDILLSDTLVSLIQLQSNNFESKYLGSVFLRGKSEKLNLHTLKV